MGFGALATADADGLGDASAFAGASLVGVEFDVDCVQPAAPATQAPASTRESCSECFMR